MLGDTILGLLAAKPPYAQLDGDVTRHKVLHSDGMVYHFDAKTLRAAKPEDRMGHRLGCSARAWDPPQEVAAEAASVFGKVTDYGRRADPNADDELRTLLRALAQYCHLLNVLHSFAGSWEEVIYLLRKFARAVGGCARFCEFLYIYGPGSSGKDVVLLLFLTFFGEAPDNLGCVLNGDFIVDASGGFANKEAASPFLAATQGKRFIWPSEVPQHKNLQVGVIKQYCEQYGAPMTCRKLYKGPVSFRPIGLIVASSNYAPIIANKDDDGFHRRARIWQTTQTFRAHPTKLTEHKADDTLKGRILQGVFNPQLVWLLRGAVGDAGAGCQSWHNAPANPSEHAGAGDAQRRWRLPGRAAGLDRGFLQACGSEGRHEHKGLQEGCSRLLGRLPDANRPHPYRRGHQLTWRVQFEARACCRRGTPRMDAGRNTRVARDEMRG